MTVRAVLLDIDGTLFDTRGARARFAQSMYGIAIASESEPPAVFCSRIARACGESTRMVLDAYRRHVHRFDERRPALSSALRQLSGVCVLGVLSNGSGPIQRRKLDASVPLEDIPFRVVHISGETRLTKPSRRAFEHAAAGLGVECRRVLHLGDDADADVAGARAAGMQACRVGGPSELPALIDELARSGRLG